MTRCLFVADLHGRRDRYEKLFRIILCEKPDAVFLGGDLLPHAHHADGEGGFIASYLKRELVRLRDISKGSFPAIFAILGNDDGRFEEEEMEDGASAGLWNYTHNRMLTFDRWRIFGYSYVPPTPFRLKDWERYDVSRFVDPGCISPEEGVRSVPVSRDESRFSTILQDLEDLAGNDDMRDAVFLFHAPPYKTNLDRADIDGRMVDHVPVDPHVGSIAIRRFIEEKQPLLTLHGHIHESPRLTGSWKERIGKTILLSAAHDGPELALVRIDLEDPGSAERELI
jgi:Icc-related predicted phosphoesterase